MPLNIERSIFVIAVMLLIRIGIVFFNTQWRSIEEQGRPQTLSGYSRWQQLTSMCLRAVQLQYERHEITVLVFEVNPKEDMI